MVWPDQAGLSMNFTVKRPRKKGGKSPPATKRASERLVDKAIRPANRKRGRAQQGTSLSPFLAHYSGIPVRHGAGPHLSPSPPVPPRPLTSFPRPLPSTRTSYTTKARLLPRLPPPPAGHQSTKGAPFPDADRIFFHKQSVNQTPVAPSPCPLTLDPWPLPLPPPGPPPPAAPPPCRCAPTARRCPPARSARTPPSPCRWDAAGPGPG